MPNTFDDNIAPSTNYETVTPSDTVALTRPSRSLYVGTAGNVVAIRDDGTAVTFVNVQNGQVLPIVCKRVNSTSTTALNIVSLA